MYRESRHLDRKNSRFCVRSARNRLFFRRKRVLGETNKHPPHNVRVVRLVSLRRLSNKFDSRKQALPAYLCYFSTERPPAATGATAKIRAFDTVFLSHALCPAQNRPKQGESFASRAALLYNVRHD